MELVSRLNDISRQLTELAQDVAAAGGAGEPKEVAEKMLRNECIYCGKVVDENTEQYRRGLCQAHYQKFNTAIKSHQLSEREAVRLGWWGPAQRPGKKPSSPDKLEQYLLSRGKSPAPSSTSATPAPDFTDVATGDASPGATEATEREAVKPHKGLSTGEVAPDSGVRPPQGKRAKVKPKGK